MAVADREEGRKRTHDIPSVTIGRLLRLSAVSDQQNSLPNKKREAGEAKNQADHIS